VRVRIVRLDENGIKQVDDFRSLHLLKGAIRTLWQETDLYQKLSGL
jgi:hypothetical protein